MCLYPCLPQIWTQLIQLIQFTFCRFFFLFSISTFERRHSISLFLTFPISAHQLGHCACVCLVKAQATGIQTDVWPFSDMAPHDREKCFNVPDASQREMDHQPLVFWTLGASWHCCVSVKCACVCVCVCVCVCAFLSVTHCCGMAEESRCVAACYLDRPLKYFNGATYRRKSPWAALLWSPVAPCPVLLLYLCP